MSSDSNKYFAHMLLTHGAGAPVSSEFMQLLYRSLENEGIKVTLFNFAYMQKMVDENKKRPPTKLPVLIREFGQLCEQENSKLPFFIGGKSMGGRVATHVACEPNLSERISGVLAYGYPFHPIGKPEKTRTDHLSGLNIPALFIQGKRDGFGNYSEVQTYDLPKMVNVSWIEDGDHSFKPRKTSGFTLQAHIQLAAEMSAKFMQSIIQQKGQ